MEKIAGILGDWEAKQEYRALAEKIREFWNETFLDPEDQEKPVPLQENSVIPSVPMLWDWSME